MDFEGSIVFHEYFDSGFAPSFPRKYACMQAHCNSLVTKPGKWYLSILQDF